MKMARRVARVRPRADREVHKDMTGRQVIEFPRRRRPLQLPGETLLTRRGWFVLVLAISIVVVGVFVLVGAAGPRR